MSKGPAGLGALGAALAAHDDRLSNCVHCGFCLPACPTYVRLCDEADSPRGRLHLMRAVADQRLDPGSEAFQVHIHRCLGCRACETVCPSGVEYGFLLERARQVAGRARRSAVLPGLLLALIERPIALAVWMGASRLIRWTRAPALLARRGPGWAWLRTLRLAAGMLSSSSAWTPSGAETGEHAAGSGAAPGPVDTSGGGRQSAGTRGRVGLLTGCVQKHLFARVNAATCRVLAANGWEVVEVRGQGCCGALHAHAGTLSRARAMAIRNISAFRAAGLDWIVANAAGCGATMKEYDKLLEEALAGDDAEATRTDGSSGRDAHQSSGDATWFAERVRDVTELLVDPNGGVPHTGGALRLRAAYDPPCHLRHGQQITAPPLDALRSIPGLQVVLVPNGDECCGGAGIYGLSQPELGGRIGTDKVDAVLATGADVLATGNPGCAMQIGAGLRMRGSAVQVAHPIELLDESYRRGGVYDGRSRRH